MKFSRTEMIAKAQAEIERRKAAAVERHAREVAEADKKRAEWVETHLPAYNEFADTIKRRVRRGEPVVQADIPNEIRARWGDRVELFRGASPDVAPVDCSDLERLISLLDTVTDDEISSTGLVSLGYRDLSRLFR